MNLIIRAELVNPPTESLAFRHLTAVSSLSRDVLLETEKYARDIYYHYCLQRGLLDFVEDLIVPEDGEEGQRLDVKVVMWTNVERILAMVKSQI